MNPFRLLFAAITGQLCTCHFGNTGGPGSSANPETTTITTNTDKRLVVDTGSTGVSADHSTVTVTDEGAVGQAIDLAKSSSAQAYGGLKDIVGLARDVLQVETAQVANTGGILQTAAQASSSNAQLGDTLKLVLVGALALAGLFLWKAKGG